MTKFTVMIENDDVRRVWNYVLPQEHKAASFSSIKSIPVLTKQNCSKEENRQPKDF
jgi:hypothetical protein